MKHLMEKEELNFEIMFKEDRIAKGELFYLRGGEGSSGGDTGDNDNGDPGEWNP